MESALTTFALLGDLKYQLFGLVEQLVRIASLRIEGALTTCINWRKIDRSRTILAYALILAALGVFFARALR